MLIRLRLAASCVAVFLLSCSFSTTFAFSNESGESGVLVVKLSRDARASNRCPDIVLAEAPSEQLRPRWFRKAHPDWKPLTGERQVYWTSDCETRLRIPDGLAVSIIRVSNRRDRSVEEPIYSADVSVAFSNDRVSVILSLPADSGLFEQRSEFIRVYAAKPRPAA